MLQMNKVSNNFLQFIYAMENTVNVLNMIVYKYRLIYTHKIAKRKL